MGLFAAISCRLYYDGFGALRRGLYATTAGTAVAHFAAFLLPTTLMGMSLPFLVRATVRETASASRVIGALYGVNVLGAAAGALLAPWVLVRFLGMEGAALVGAVANLVAAAAALAVGRRADARARRRAPPPAAAAPSAPTARGPSRLWMLLYALSGFLALSLEIVWFRLMEVGVKSTAYTFGTVLCTLPPRPRRRQPRRRPPRRAPRPPARGVPRLPAAAPRHAPGAAVALLAWLPPGTPVYRWFFDYWRHDPFFQLGADWNAGALARLYGLLPLALFGVPTVLMGLSFGALQRAVQDDPATSGRKVGLLQAANIAGCTAGSLVTGPRPPRADRHRRYAAAARRRGRRSSSSLVRARATAGLDAGLSPARPPCPRPRSRCPSNDALWKRLHGVTADEPPAFIGEDASAVSAVVPGRGRRWRVTVNGLPHSWLPFEGIHTLLGAVPAVIHPAPEDIAVIGLGLGRDGVGGRVPAGDASACGSSRSRPASTACCAQVSAVAPFPSLVELLSDPRVAIEAADGRQALARDERRYDIVRGGRALPHERGQRQPLLARVLPRSARAASSRAGLVCTQKPSRRVGLTFAEALPHALDFGNMVVGSNDPLPIDPAAWEARLLRPQVARRFDTETLEGMRARLREARPARRNPAPRVGLNRDLFPRDEFGTPAGW